MPRSDSPLPLVSSLARNANVFRGKTLAFLAKDDTDG